MLTPTQSESWPERELTRAERQAALRDLNRRVSALEAQRPPRWIPFSENLPEPGTPVLTIRQPDHGRIAKLVDGSWYECAYRSPMRLPEPTHWQPIPPLPEDSAP